MAKKSTFLITPLPVKPKNFSEKFFNKKMKETERLAGSSFKDSKPPEARKSPSREQ